MGNTLRLVLWLTFVLCSCSGGAKYPGWTSSAIPQNVKSIQVRYHGRKSPKPAVPVAHIYLYMGGDMGPKKVINIMSDRKWSFYEASAPGSFDRALLAGKVIKGRLRGIPSDIFAGSLAVWCSAKSRKADIRVNGQDCLWTPAQDWKSTPQ